MNRSIVVRRERALKFCYGYYFLPAGDEAGIVQNALGMALDPRPLSCEERDDIIRLIERDPSVRKDYVHRFKEEGRNYT